LAALQFYRNDNWRSWDPLAALSVANAAFAIAQRCRRSTPAFLVSALGARTTILPLMAVSMRPSPRREGYEDCREPRRLRHLRTCEGAIWAEAGNFEESRRLAESMLREATALGDRTVVAMETGNLGIYLMESGDNATARRYLTDAPKRSRSAAPPSPREPGG
jgi:hypothetical protein